MATRRTPKIPKGAEKAFGPIVDRLLLGRGVRKINNRSRRMVLFEFVKAIRDGLKAGKRKAEGDYSPDPKANRFPT